MESALPTFTFFSPKMFRGIGVDVKSKFATSYTSILSALSTFKARSMKSLAWAGTKIQNWKRSTSASPTASSDVSNRKEWFLCGGAMESMLSDISPHKHSTSPLRTSTEGSWGSIREREVKVSSSYSTSCVEGSQVAPLLALSIPSISQGLDLRWTSVKA